MCEIDIGLDAEAIEGFNFGRISANRSDSVKPRLLNISFFPLQAEELSIALMCLRRKAPLPTL